MSFIPTVDYYEAYSDKERLHICEHAVEIISMYSDGQKDEVRVQFLLKHVILLKIKLIVKKHC